MTQSPGYVGTTSEMNGHLFGVTLAADVRGKPFNSTLFSINPLNGRFLWQIGLPGNANEAYGAPMWVNGVLVVNDGGFLYLVEAFNGKILYESEPGGRMTPPVSVWGGDLFVGHGDNLTAYSAESDSRTGNAASGTGTMSLGGAVDMVVARAREN